MTCRNRSISTLATLFALLTALTTAPPPAAALDPGASPADEQDPNVVGLLEGLRRAEYEFSYQDDRLQAPNRAHDLRARVDAHGIEFVSRTGGEERLRFSLRLATVGSGGDLLDVRPGTVTFDGRRAEIVRDAITEWLVNDERGIEHGFTIPSPPGGQDGEVELAMAIDGNAMAYPAGPGGIVLRDAEGTTVARYDGLVVLDAAGRALPARIEVEPGTLKIVYDDAGAAYPVTVDPLMQSPDWNRIGADSSALGASVRTAGDVNGDGYSDLLVGASGYDGGLVGEGQACVYHGGPSGVSGFASWCTESNQARARLGAAVSTAGDVNGDGYDDVIVGAWAYDNGHADEGKAWIWLGGPSGVGGSAYWTSEGNENDAYFGSSVSWAGDVNGDGYDDVVVGEPGADDGAVDTGAIHLFHGDPVSMSSVAAWAQNPLQAGSEYATSVAGAGDVNGDGYDDLVVGAPLYDAGQADEGRVYFWHGTATTPSFAGTLESNQAGAQLGAAVGPAGDVDGDGYADVVLGAPKWDNGGFVDAGKVWICYGSSSGIATGSCDVIVGPQESFAEYGASVDTAGDVNGDGLADVIVGAPNRNNGTTDEGAAYVYRGSTTGIRDTVFGLNYWVGDSGQASARYGEAVGAAGDVNGDGYGDVVVGAPSYDSFPGTNHGRAYVYLGGADGLADDRTSRSDGQTDGEFGTSVSHADVNGDGFSDLLVGEPLYDGGQADEGRLFVYLGSRNGPASTPSSTHEINEAGARLGWSVSGAGDVDGDGYDEVLVGAPRADQTASDDGRAFLYYGTASGLQVDPGWATQFGGTSSSWIGYSVSKAGDVNGDGYGDFVVGAPLFDGGQSDEGRAWVFHGSATGPGDGVTAAAVLEINQSFSQFGRSVGWAGDLDGDGYDDIVVGAPYQFSFQSGAGRAHVFYGSSSGVGTSPDWTVGGNQQDAHFGWSVGTAGDIDGDGLADLVVGEPDYEDPSLTHVDEGRFHVYLGGASRVPTFLAERQGNETGARLGKAVGTAGDVNGDGYADVVTGAPDNTGRITVWYGAPSGFPATQSWSVLGGNRGGSAVGTAGDVNGDGFDDVVYGAPGGGTIAGMVRVHYGGDGDGMDRIPRMQQPSSTSSPRLALAGKSTDASSVRLQSRARTAAGRNRVQVEYEVKPIFEPFDGTGTSFSSELLSSSPGSDGSRVNYSTRVSGLTGGPHYKWRLRHLSPNPLFPRTPWFKFAGIAPTQPAFKTSCTVQSWYLDGDGDGYGDPSTRVDRCDAPAGYVGNAGDCDDGDPDVNPGVAEVPCDAVDNDCNAGTPDVTDDDGDGVDSCDVGTPGNTDGQGIDNCPDTPNPDQADADADGWGDACDLCPGVTDDVDGDGTQGPCVVETGWALVRTIALADAHAAHFSSFDGLLYVGQRSGTRGLYRIEADDTLTALWTGDDIASVAIDPVDGDVFTTDDFSGEIFRTAFGATGREVWTSGFHAGDDDPVGMAIAPSGYTGSVVAPGEGLVVDRGSSNPDEIWQWSPSVLQDQSPVHTDDGTLVDAVDVAIDDVRVLVADTGGTAAGTIWEVGPGGALTPLTLSEPIEDARALAFDPLDGSLVVGDGASDGGARRVVRVDLASGTVADVFRGFVQISWAGVDVTDDGTEVAVTDRSAGRVYVFSRDFDGDGVADAQDNCPVDANPDQADADGDGFGDACDLCPGFEDDLDGDGDAGPCVLYNDWHLERTIAFTDPMAAHLEPGSRRIFVGRRSGDKGLYRIDPDGTITAIWTGDDIAAVAIDPADGDVFASDDFSGEIFRTASGGTGREVWTSGFHDGDDDPVGMAIAPAGFTGGVVAPGEALVVDRGANGLDEIWRWVPATQQDQSAVHTDDGTLVDAVDVAFTPSRAYVIDTGGGADGAIYEVQAGGTLVAAPLQTPIAEGVGLAYDPTEDALFVVESGGNGGRARVLTADPFNGQTSDFFRGFVSPSWAGIDADATGTTIVVTDRGDNRIHVFIKDRDNDGVPDGTDNCPLYPNGEQHDSDGDGVGDACDDCPFTAGSEDLDGDGFCELDDCAPNDPDAWGVPGPALDLQVDKIAGVAELSWTGPLDPGGTSVLFDVVRSDDVTDFAGPGATCVATDTPSTSASDAANPMPATLFGYLVRSENPCGASSAGTRTDGTERTTTTCP